MNLREMALKAIPSDRYTANLANVAVAIHRVGLALSLAVLDHADAVRDQAAATREGADALADAIRDHGESLSGP